MESTYTRKHGLRGWKESNGVGEKGIVEGVKVLTLFLKRSHAYLWDFVSHKPQQDAMHNDVLLSQRLLACLLIKRKEGSKKANASGFEFCRWYSLIVD